MAGVRVIAIDPITAAEANSRPWIADLQFLMRVKTAVRRSGASLILVTHPRIGGQAKDAMSSLAGGAAYVRLAQNVVWLAPRNPPEALMIQTKFGPQEFDCNRVIELVKCRNGRGQGLKIGCHFDADTLRTTEFGIIKK